MWIVATLICTGMLVFSLATSILNFVKNEVNVSVKMTHKSQLQFPAVTVNVKIDIILV